MSLSLICIIIFRIVYSKAWYPFEMIQQILNDIVCIIVYNSIFKLQIFIKTIY